MQNDLVNKYLMYKTKTLMSYALSLYKVYDIEDEKLWTTEKEFMNIMSKIISIYTNKYYLRDKNSFKALNKNNLSEKDFKMTLALAVVAEYFGKSYEEIKVKYKKSIYNLTLILYIVTNVDKDISFYSKTSVTIKNITKQIDKLFSDVIGKAEIDKNPFIIDILANKIREAEQKEIRFFESLKSSESYIEFKEYGDMKYYLDYNYDLKKLYSYNVEDIKIIYSKFKFKEQYFDIVYDLGIITILKAYSNNCNLPLFIMPISTTYIKAKGNIDYLNKIFSSNYIKNNVCFSLTFNDYKNNSKDIYLLNQNKYKVAIYISEHDFIEDINNLDSNYKYYIESNFIEQSPLFVDAAKNKNIDYEIISKNKFINEDELINVCLKEENNEQLQ